MALPARTRTALGALLASRKPSDVAWKDVADLAGVPKSTLDQWISGKAQNPPLRGVLRVARVLHVPLSDLADAALADDPTLDAAAARGEALEVVRRRLEDQAAARRSTRTRATRVDTR